MAILVNSESKVLIQGITGKQGTFHLKQMQAFGTQVVAGVAPGKGGGVHEGVPLYESVFEACENHQIDASVLFIPAAFCKDAALEAIEAGIKVIVIITEHIPVVDELIIVNRAKLKGATIIGPNTFGMASWKCKLGILPNVAFSPGPVGIVARSGTLTYEIVGSLTNVGIGQTSVVGLGGDRVPGSTFVDMLKLFEADPETKAVVLVGEIGGNAEEEAAEYIKTMSKPVVAYLAGKSAPPGKRMGHAGAIIERGKGTYEGKIQALEAAGARIAIFPYEVAQIIQELLA
ncbi:succinate--CoA ligase subunit alpha [Heliophilum fasciatum]|uniref:Succinate--CoA ligase [ADP-forming] subunit alpha n=1 Tax=Heliophilum fasciatum TaxID=35700 RepID=A0A4R2RV06_9FIRM|nr:succinate--CoA ligase subunit alpha [Heliophilum fasciatum]MCW2277398.1 succinyl-CoA synthetase alpha subunit [Heliophilum fasciatum]TCP67234.1 succinyl-CoA synthetase (ADP-forming) alpha subunit [Heliophilum fasciatum]